MSRRGHLEALHAASPVILPSLLLCDFGNLEREVRLLEQAGVKALHLDVMDGVFVPNFTYGMTIVDALRKLTDLPLDVHLMMQSPENYLQNFYDAGADIITFHAEAVADPLPVLKKLNSMQVGAGLAINPATSVESVAHCLPHCDLFLVMSVKAGFGGQEFNPVALEKLAAVRALAGEKLLLEVDGGINEQTISRCAAAGAQLFVVGSAIFKKPNYGSAVSQLRASALSIQEAQ
jgi:ribulose-phosphate 3-epimerase